ncbi:MAG TPA: hypothetical protein VF483_07070, partial [Gemmatimonadaceae bacterium]
MGSARWSDADWKGYSSSVADKPRDAVFTSSGLDDSLNPAKFTHRESRDSAVNPDSTPVIIGCDETGSMGELAEIIIKKGLGVVMGGIYDHKPVPDPHICCLALGDAYYDSAPLQATQFEASIVIAEQVAKMYIEGRGGANNGESYALAWWFALNKVKADAIEKRRRKGYLFTIGDECCLPVITREQVAKYGGVAQSDIPVKVLLEEVSKDWEVFHIIIKPVSSQPVVSSWRDLLGQRAVLVEDHSKIAEVILATMRVNEGH